MAAVPAIGRAAKVERSAAPGSDATRDLYERFSAQIMGYCLHQLGSREEAEDAVQTTFMNAFRGLQRGIVPALESAWLFKIAHNVCLSRRRSSWRRDRIESPAEFDAVQELAPAPPPRRVATTVHSATLPVLPVRQAKPKPKTKVHIAHAAPAARHAPIVPPGRGEKQQTPPAAANPPHPPSH